MNEHALYHRPESEYAYALDSRTLRIVLRVAAGESIVKAELLHNNKYDFTKRRDVSEMSRISTDGLFDYYGADIVLNDVRFAYIFKLYTPHGVYYYSEAGLADDYDFALAYYTFYQFPFINPSDVVERIPWTRDAVFYQIFIDRFCRGNFVKDDGYITQEWDAVPQAQSYCGGDIRGIIQKLDYLVSTGVNALYLTPVFSAYSNHKYNLKSYTDIDPQFGTNADVRRLLDEAHARDMRVMLDTVFNHCDISHEYFADVTKHGRKSKYYDWFIIDGDFPDYEAGNYAYFADCKYMPKWNTNNKKVRDYFVGLAVAYVMFGFDGLRLDVADEVSHTMWRELRTAVKAVRPDALLLGEVWHENTHYLLGDEFDGVMNYRAHKILLDYFAPDGITAESAADRLNRLLMQNYEQVNGMMLNFLDNHDTPRFLRFAGGKPDRVLAALCVLMLFPGIPCVFYGTEIPLDGAGDPDCRRTFDWAAVERGGDYFERYKKILALKKEPCVEAGTTLIEPRDGMLVIVRDGGGERVTAFFNRCGRALSVDPCGEVLYSQGFDGKTLAADGALVVKERSSVSA